MDTIMDLPLVEEAQGTDLMYIATDKALFSSKKC